MSNSSVWPIARNLLGATSPGQSGPRTNGNEWVFRIPQSANITGAARLECLMIISKTFSGSLPENVLDIILPFFRDAISWLGYRTFVEGESYLSTEMQLVYSTVSANWATGHWLRGALPLCRDAVGIFYFPSRRGHRTFVGGSFSSLRRCSQYFLLIEPTGPQDIRWGWELDLFAEMQSVYSTARADWAAGHSLSGGALPLCSDAVGIFYCSSWLGNRTFVGQGSLTSLQRCSRYILLPEPTGPQGIRWGGSFTSLQRCSQYILLSQPTELNFKLILLLVNCYHFIPELKKKALTCVLSLKWMKISTDLQIFANCYKCGILTLYIFGILYKSCEWYNRKFISRLK